MRRPNRTSPKRRRSRREGFNFFKLKIGVKPLADEIAAAHAIRKALPDDAALRRRQLRADACGRAPLCERTRDADLAFIEQPLPATISRA